MAKYLVITAGLIALAVATFALYWHFVKNPAVMSELTTNPAGELAGTVMLLTFADGKQLPVNYLREGDKVFVGADGPWWRAFRGSGAPATVLIRGESFTGHAIVELEDQVYVNDVFARLRPTVPAWLPDSLNGKLVVITLGR